MAVGLMYPGRLVRIADEPTDESFNPHFVYEEYEDPETGEIETREIEVSDFDKFRGKRGFIVGPIRPHDHGASDEDPFWRVKFLDRSLGIEAFWTEELCHPIRSEHGQA